MADQSLIAQDDAPFADIDTANLPELTAKQSKFVEGLLSGLTGADAYREAYDTESAKSAWAEASRLKANPKIAAWLAAGRRIRFKAVTLEAHLANLAELKAMAIGQGDVSVATTCEKLAGTVSGLYVERMKIESDDLSDMAALLQRAFGADTSQIKRVQTLMVAHSKRKSADK